MTDRTPPKVENAPGIVWKARKNEWVAIWQPRTDLVKRGYPSSTVHIWRGAEPNDKDREFISDQCTRLQDAMLIWGRGGLVASAVFDGTVRSLTQCYRTDPDSNYRNKLRYNTRSYYDALMKRINDDHGDTLIADLDARAMMRWHEDLTKRGVAMAHGTIGMLRTLTTFGTTLLKDRACKELKMTMHDMRFTMAKPRTERLTAVQAAAIIAEAHRRGLHSLALAQAIQFEGMLRQKDVIGEWVPTSEPGVSDVTHESHKWLRGVRWSEIDENLVLRHVTSKRQKQVVIDFKLSPMVLAEFARIGDLPRTGPIVVSETTGRPWRVVSFRHQWRKLANAAGIPKAVKNMDSRAGAISEATDAGAPLEHVRHSATHSNIATTQNYSRGVEEKTANVQKLRTEYRNKSGTS